MSTTDVNGLQALVHNYEIEGAKRHHTIRQFVRVTLSFETPRKRMTTKLRGYCVNPRPDDFCTSGPKSKNRFSMPVKRWRRSSGAIVCIAPTKSNPPVANSSIVFIMADMQVLGSQQRPLKVHFQGPDALIDSLFAILPNKPTKLFSKATDTDCDLSLCLSSVSFEDAKTELLRELGQQVLVCIGDQHGNLDLVKALYQNLASRFGSLFPFLTVLFVGDSCDRGTLRLTGDFWID